MTYIAAGRKAISNLHRRCSAMPRNALGRGLGALIREAEPQKASPTPADAVWAEGNTLIRSGAHTVSIGLIDTSPYQPRSKFREGALEELSRSIQKSGIIQPVIVRPVKGRFQLIAGERRWRAAQRAGLQAVPAIFKDVPDELALEMTLIENIQREDLNPIEEARAFDRLRKEFNLSQETVAEGKRRAKGGTRAGELIVEFYDDAQLAEIYDRLMR